MKSERWKQIEQLYYAASKLDAGRRAAFLDQACGSDEALRREVASLLASDAKAGSFLAAPAADVVAESMPPSIATSLSQGEAQDDNLISPSWYCEPEEGKSLRESMDVLTGTKNARAHGSSRKQARGHEAWIRRQHLQDKETSGTHGGATKDPASDFSESLFLRDEGLRGRDSGLPPDLLAQSARRLRILALLYAFVFFMARYFPALLVSVDREHLFSRFVVWGPGAISIAGALLVAALTSNPRIPIGTIMIIGLGFEVASSFGIAAAEFLDPAGLDFTARSSGLSWVALWTLLFTVVVPSSPRRTVIATLASVSSVPVVVAFVIANNALPGVTSSRFFFGFIFPYLLVVVMAYVGARVIYALGKEVTRARALGGYRLVECLGTGGMGEVWRAKHDLLARPAAIKLVRPEFPGAPDDPRQRQIQERFGREAQATAMMRSPHTIEVYDFGLANDGTFYYVMELLDGFDLETLVKRFGAIPAERAINLLIQVCHSLDEAHAQGLIHRDIKPANVFVCRYGREVDFVKVLDFGMVKSQREPENEPKLTGEHVVCGTPAFMAPEQVLGNQLVDGRTDLYAIGCLAYWLITGQHVFTGRTAMEILMQHTQAVPVPPSKRTEIEVPPGFDDLILLCLAKNPDDRPASAETLAEALRCIATTSSWTTPRAQEWWNRHHPCGQS